MRKQRTLKNNTKRRILLKKIHQRVLVRRKQFALNEMQQDFQEAC
ncbi:hypothetical protein [Glaciecola sp. XM2]|jgi:hypothetical protein|nr:hypothetical protein [Glaciecola sp. XM2]